VLSYLAALPNLSAAEPSLLKGAWHRPETRLCQNLRGQTSSRYGGTRNPPGPRLEQELGFALELPDPPSRVLKLRGELGERRRIPVVEAVAPHQDVAGFLRQTSEAFLSRLYLFYGGVRDAAGRLVEDEVL
jgi:hypothetical protein